jgi:hypothetical protein
MGKGFAREVRRRKPFGDTVGARRNIVRRLLLPRLSLLAFQLKLSLLILLTLDSTLHILCENSTRDICYTTEQ